MGNCASINLMGQTSKNNLNQVDAAGLKQGRWVITENELVVEEGVYVDDLKQGIWKAYYQNRNLKHEINFINGEAKGTARFYYKNGTLRESGNWQLDHWEGSYQYYFESGELSYDWYYNENGKREGEQVYYHANGKKMYQGKWENGKTDGTLKVYNDSGQLVLEKTYNNGQIAKIEEPVQNEQNNSSVRFTQTGFHTVVHLNGKIDKKGFFVKGNLFNGEKHHYDEQGNLVSVTQYKNGKVVATKEQ
ncbi:toxin-antitoxin system YwqK family antitoxin [Saccharicrinis sp. GN24d3]